MSNDANYAVPEEGIDTNIKRKDVSFLYLIDKSIYPFTSYDLSTRSIRLFCPKRDTLLRL